MNLTTIDPEKQVVADNPLLKEWTGQYHGVPPFDQVKVADFKPAFEAAMNEHLSEVEAIANNTVPADFENTIAAFERAGKTLDRVSRIYGIWASTMNGPEFQPLEREMSPILSSFSDKIYMNEKLFKRIASIYEGDKSKLTSEQQRLVWLHYTNFVKSGARLNADDKAKLTQINQQLAKLFTTFRQNLLADETEKFVLIDKQEDLAGLPESLIASARELAGKKQLDGKWVISNTRSSVDPFLTFSDVRSQREKVWRMFVNRGDNGDKNDNNAVITEILKLRKQRATLLGYQTHAHWRLENTMAKTPEKTLELMEAVWTPAISRVKEEVRDMQAIAAKTDPGFKIQPWDYKYYAEKVRKERFDLDQNEVKEYMQLEKLREGMFWVAEQLFNFQFKPVENVPVYHPDVRVWEVTDKTSGPMVF